MGGKFTVLLHIWGRELRAEGEKAAFGARQPAFFLSPQPFALSPASLS